MKLAFRKYGEGKPLVILHGLFGQSDNWNTLAKQFATAGFSVFTIDQRNHGLSPHSSEFNFGILAADLNEFINEQGLDKPLLLGHSLGGKTVLFHELKFPGSASKLIIADMAARSYAPKHDSVISALKAVDFNKVKNRKEVEAILAENRIDPGTRQFLLKNLHWKDEANTMLAWRFNLDSISAHYNEVNKAVPEFVSKVPALIIRGGNSDYVTEDDVADFLRRFPKMKLVTIPGSGHWLHAEKPIEFYKEVLGFISA